MWNFGLANPEDGVHASLYGTAGETASRGLLRPEFRGLRHSLVTDLTVIPEEGCELPKSAATLLDRHPFATPGIQKPGWR